MTTRPAPGTTAQMPEARGAGCGCKLPPDLLARALAHMPPPPANADILVGHARMDDAAAHRIADDLAVVSTIDFFTPVVPDAATFGAIAATNALSDVYAMGGTPLLALAVVVYPRDADPAALAATMTAGAEVAAAHGCPVLGGHSIDGPEPLYGLSVVGTAHPDHLMTNDAGRAGDRLVLTKPLGIGIAIAASGAGDDGMIDDAIALMRTSNRDAARAAVAAGVRCATDVTGFGLLGHLREIAAASGLHAWVDPTAVPVLAGAPERAAAGVRTGGGRRNADALAGDVTFAADVPEALRVLLADPQTSGGLLIAVPPERVRVLRAALATAGVPAAEVGLLADGPPGRITVGGPRPA